MPAAAQRLAVAGEALGADRRVGAGDVGDPGVAEREQVVGREPRAEPVVDLHDRDRREVDVAVEADDREAVLDERRDPLGREPEAVHEHAVHVLGAQQPQVARLLLRVAVRRAQQHALVALQHELLDAAHELGVERVGDVGQEQRDRLRRAGDEAAGDRVRAVAELRDRIVDRRARRRARSGPVPLSARETVAVETPASRATS